MTPWRVISISRPFGPVTLHLWTVLWVQERRPQGWSQALAINASAWKWHVTFTHISLANLRHMAIGNLKWGVWVSLGSQCIVVDNCLPQSSQIEIDTSRVHPEPKGKEILMGCRESHGRLHKDGDKWLKHKGMSRIFLGLKRRKGTQTEGGSC